jgi:hypothetical protein
MEEYAAQGLPAAYLPLDEVALPEGEAPDEDGDEEPGNAGVEGLA